MSRFLHVTSNIQQQHNYNIIITALADIEILLHPVSYNDYSPVIGCDTWAFICTHKLRKTYFTDFTEFETLFQMFGLMDHDVDRISWVLLTLSMNTTHPRLTDTFRLERSEKWTHLHFTRSNSIIVPIETISDSW